MEFGKFKIHHSVLIALIIGIAFYMLACRLISVIAGA